MQIWEKLITFISLVLTVVSFSENEEWHQFKQTHGKKYHSLGEERLRFNIFQKNLNRIQNHNRKYHSGSSTFKFGVNYFVDLFPAELQKHMGTMNTTNTTPVYEGYHYDPPDNLIIPGSKDWREFGAVTEVRHQLQCGACWAFSSLATIESHLYLTRSENLTSLSVQNLVDCASSKSGYKIHGCDGGEISEAFRYIMDNGVIPENDYPYLGRVCPECLCRQACQDLNDDCVHIKDFAYIPSLNENRIMAAVGTMGPVAVAIDADEMFFYYGGIMNDEIGCRNDSVNHGVTIVGYGTEETVDYWIVKNSWGSLWGENGYFRIRRGVNQCGIALVPTFPLV